MKKFIALLLTALTVLSLTACSGNDADNIPDGMGYYEYDTAPNSETGWNTEQLSSVGLIALRKPKGTKLVSADGQTESELILFLINEDESADVDRKIYENMVKEITDLVKRDDKFIKSEDGYDDDNASAYTEICYEYNGKKFAAYIAYYENSITDEYYSPACIGISVTSYNTKE